MRISLLVQFGPEIWLRQIGLDVVVKPLEMDQSIVIDRFRCENWFVMADLSRNLAATDRSELVMW